jgi:hypothetical protein
MRKYCVFSCDMGGTFIKSACINTEGKIVGAVR